jgi:hypothetical protein
LRILFRYEVGNLLDQLREFDEGLLDLKEF